MREIITLQLGQQSNYLATHFWNAQESYFTYGDDQEPSPVDHDVHFRPGLGADGAETYMPRTVIYDLKGGFGSMRKINALYDAQDEVDPTALWNGQAVVHRQDPIAASAYQASLETGAPAPALTPASVRYWSDFNRVFYHPASVVQLNEYELHSTLRPFERWAMGEELFASLDRDQDLVDRDLRPFAEEADQMQGIQVLAGLDDAWGGFAAKYLERLRDDYGKMPIWVWGLQEPTAGLPRDKRLLRLTNKARSLAELCAHASLVVPVALPPRGLPARLALDPTSPWHVSALFGAALESTSLYMRLRPAAAGAHATTMGALTDALNVFGRQTLANLQMAPVGPPAPSGQPPILSGRGDLLARLADAQYAAPPPAIDDDDDPDARDTVTSLSVDLSALEDGLGQPARRRKAHLFAQIETARGEHAVRATSAAEKKAEDDGAYGAYGAYGGAQRRQKTHRYQSPLAFPLLDSYPATLFPREDGPPDAAGAADPRLSVRTVLSADSSVQAKVRGLRGLVLRSFGLEDREDLGNRLADMADGYAEGWSSGSDDDDDDEDGDV